MSREQVSLYREEIRDAVNERVRVIQPYLPHALNELSMVAGQPVILRDGYAGLRYVSRILYKMNDPQAIRAVPPTDLFVLLKDGIVGAAHYRIKKLAPQASSKSR